MSRRTAVLAAFGDLLAVVLFVVAGRSNHQEDGGIGDLVVVIAPFAIALAAGWLALRAWRTPLAAVPTGIVLWLCTAGGGLLLRRVAFQRSTALAFVIVGSVFLLLVLVGWRVVVGAVVARRRKVT